MKKIKLPGIVFLFCCVIGMTSCTLENKIKDSLKKETQKTCPNYILVGMEISDSIMKTDLRDSIVSIKYNIEGINFRIKLDSISLAALNDDLQMYIRQDKSTPNVFGEIIKNFELSIESKKEQKTEHQNLLSKRENDVKTYENLIATNKGSFVFYVCNHTYECDGKQIQETVWFDKDLNLFKP